MIISKHFRFTVLGLLLTLGGVQTWASTGDAGFVAGNYEITPSGDDTSAVVQVAGIRNTTANTTSGSLGFELWYSSTPYSGGTIDGYKVAASYLPIGNCTSSQLGPGQGCTAIAVTDTLTVPPAGTYYPVLLLVEFSPSCATNNGYCIDDYVDLTNLVTGGPTITVGGVNDGGSGSTGNAELAGPAQVSGIDWTADTVDITVASVTNLSNVTSGSLAIQLWFTANPYMGGAIASGYKVASFPLPASCTTGQAQLNAGMTCNAISSGTISVTAPPAGTYYAALLLVEYNPSICPSNAGYCIDNGLALQNQETVPDPITVTSIASTGGGGGGGGDLYWLDVVALAALVAMGRLQRAAHFQVKRITGASTGVVRRSTLHAATEVCIAVWAKKINKSRETAVPTHVDNLRAFWLRLAPNAKRIRLITLFAGVGLASCASTSTKTNRDVAYSGHPTRVFVIANLGGFGAGLPNEFEKRFVTDVTSCGGAVEFSKVSTVEIANPLSLGTSPDAISASKVRMAQMKTFSPDALLTMRVAHTTRTQSGQLLDATVETYVWDIKSGKKIWAGVSTVHMGGIFVPDSTRAQSLYDDLASKLRADGMIPECAAPPTPATKST